MGFGIFWNAMIIRIFLTIFLLLTISSCRWITGGGSPFFKWSNIKIPPGTPVFQQGFKDGCSTVLYARGNYWYRMRYSYTYDPQMIGNPEYRFGHSRGYSWCFQNIVGPGPLSSFDRYINPSGAAWGYGVFDTKVDDIGTNWDGMFGDGSQGPWYSSLTGTSNGLNGIFDVLQKGTTGRGVFDSNPLWAGGSKGQILGQDYDGAYFGDPSR